MAVFLVVFSSVVIGMVASYTIIYCHNKCPKRKWQTHEFEFNCEPCCCGQNWSTCIYCGYERKCNCNNTITTCFDDQ